MTQFTNKKKKSHKLLFEKKKTNPIFSDWRLYIYRYLKVGPKFCPTQISNLGELKRDLREFEQKLRLIEKFHKKKKRKKKKGKKRLLIKINLNSSWTKVITVNSTLSLKSSGKLT